MHEMSFGDIVFIILVLGTIYTCLQLARRAGRGRDDNKNASGKN